MARSYSVDGIYSARGFVAIEKAMPLKHSDADHANGFFTEAYELYLKAASCLPLDEESRLRYLLLFALDLECQCHQH